MGCMASREEEEEEEDMYVNELPHLSYDPGVAVPAEFAAKYQMRSLLGRGAFSQVVRVDNKLTKQPFAVKVVEHGQTPLAAEQLETELAVLRRVRHPNLVRFVEAYSADGHTFIVMDIATGGELFDRILERGTFSEMDASRVVRMVLGGVAYLHQHGIAHRDLKPENILYYHPGADSRVMITDFGLAKLKPDAALGPHSTAGSLEYLAPEVLDQGLLLDCASTSGGGGDGAHRSGGFGAPSQAGVATAVDLWAVGVITFILVLGYMPFEALDPDTGEVDQPALFRAITAARYDFRSPEADNLSDNCRSFIKALLVRSPRARLAAEPALAHAWIVRQQGNEASNRIHSSHLLSIHRENTYTRVQTPLTPGGKPQSPRLSAASARSTPLVMAEGAEFLHVG